MLFSSEVQLQIVLVKAVKDAIDEVLEKAQKLLEDEVVRAGIPANAGGIAYAWDTVSTVIGNAIMGELNYSPDKLVLVQADFPDGRHGSTLAPVKGGTPPSDVRQGFADIIFQGLAPISPMLGVAGGTQPARDAWTPFVNKLSSKIDKWIASALRNQGLMVV